MKQKIYQRKSFRRQRLSGLNYCISSIPWISGCTGDVTFQSRFPRMWFCVLLRALLGIQIDITC